MTLYELNKHHDLLDRRQKAVEMRDALMSAACPGAQKLTGMPHATGVSDKVGDLAVEIAEVDDEIQRLDAEIHTSEAIITAWLSEIEDMKTRIIFRLRFIRGYQWKEIAGVVGQYQTESSVRGSAYRYLKEHGDADCALVEQQEAFNAVAYGL